MKASSGKSRSGIPPISRTDALLALVVGLVGLAVYLRTLAPDILFGDSAEFQALAYTLGMTHSTGYPSYLLLGRIVGFLPIGNLAWRINLLSAICAALTLAGLYLLGRYFTRSRVGPLLAVLALGISYTFWSQAIIAEVYTPGLAFITVVLLLVFRWAEEPAKRWRALFTSAFLAGIGVGVHASVWLIAPPLVIFVLWVLLKQRHSDRVQDGAHSQNLQRSLIAGSLGAVVGIGFFLLAFFAIDHHNPPTSFIRTTLFPSREFWNLTREQLDSPLERLWLTLFSAQWRPAMFPGGEGFFLRELVAYWDRLIGVEFSILLLLLAAVGALVVLIRRPPLGGLLAGIYLTSLFFILNYQPGDKYVFYLSTYIPLIVSLGAGFGALLDGISHTLAQEAQPFEKVELSPQGVPGWPLTLTILFLLALILLPRGASRWQALKEGKAIFVWDEYVFPVSTSLDEPHFRAGMFLTGIPEDAALVMDWRAMYTMAYLAAVERGYSDMRFYEAMPYGNQGEVATTLVEELTTLLQEGRPVYAEQRYPGLDAHFRILPASNNLYKLSLRK